MIDPQYGQMVNNMHILKLVLVFVSFSFAISCSAENDPDHKASLLLAKFIIVQKNIAEYEVAASLLEQIKPLDETGDVEFFQSLLLIRKNEQPINTDKIIQLLKSSADKKHPLGLCLIYKIYSEPFLISTPDYQQANFFKETYQGLYEASMLEFEFDVACSRLSKIL